MTIEKFRRSAFGLIGASVLLCASCQQPQTAVQGDGGSKFQPDDGVACSGTQCSRDLHAIVDACDGHVVTTCATGLGCGVKGTCVPACEAAADAQGSLGCDFVTVPPDTTIEGRNGGCYAAFLANTWDEPVSIHMDYDNQEQDISQAIYVPVLTGEKTTYQVLSGALLPGQGAVVFMSDATEGINGSGSSLVTRCPIGIKAALAFDPIEHGTTVTKSFRLRSDRPVSAYAIFPYGGAQSYIASATLLYPTASLGTSYMLIDGWSNFHTFTEAVSQIVASEDDTEIQLTPVIDLADGNHGVKGTAAGEIMTYSLSRGDVLQFNSQFEFNGSIASGNKPFAVFGGNTCMNITDHGTCDTGSQQLAAVNQWGTEYAAVRYRSRLTGAGEEAESVPWRVIAAVDGTILTYDPEPPVQAPGALSKAENAVFYESHPFSVHSQDSAHPINLSAYMTGAYTNIGNGMGDPEFVNVVPTDQYLSNYIFYSDVTYRESSLTFVRRKTDAGFRDVTLDCAGVLDGWQPLGNGGTLEYVRVDLSRGFTPVDIDGGGTCFVGTHEMHSDGPFTATVWGWDTACSYAYPVGTGIRPLNAVGFALK